MPFGACKKCKTDIADDERFVVCEGFCPNSKYHTSCVDIMDDECDACCNDNIIWMCDDCRDFLLNYKCRTLFNTMQSEESRVDRLNAEICELSKTVNRLMEDVQHKTSIVKSSPPMLPIERPNSEESSPLSSTKIDVLPKCSAASDNIMMQTNLNDSGNSSNGPFKLFLSNIAIDVTEVEIEEMVCGILGTTDSLNVKRLVPPWKDISSMDYVSFKVEMDSSLKATALSSRNWPTNIRRREFKEYSNGVWRPMNRSSVF